MMVLSDLYCNIGKFSDAYVCKEKGLRLQQKLLGHSNPIFIDILNSIIWLIYMAEDFHNMSKYFDEMINYITMFQIDNSEFAINMFNLIDQYESNGNIINIEHGISILEYILDIIFMSRGNHDIYTITVKEKLANKLKIQADLIYQRYQSIQKSSEWTDNEIFDIALVIENTIIENEIDEALEVCIPEFEIYFNKTNEILIDNLLPVTTVDTGSVIDGVRTFTLDEILDDTDEVEVNEKQLDPITAVKYHRRSQPYIRQNRTSLEDMQTILRGILHL